MSRPRRSNSLPRRSGPPSSSSSPLSRSVAVTVRGIRRYSKRVLGTMRAMARRSADAGKRLRANRPITSTNGSNGVPAPRAAPTTAPMDVATMWLGTRFACSSARNAPACASALAPPPDNTRTTLLTSPLVVAAFHHPGRAALRGAVVAPLFIRSLGHDRSDLRRPAVLVERYVGDVTRVRMTLLAADHVFGEDFDANLHRGLAREIHPRQRRHQLADVNRLV